MERFEVDIIIPPGDTGDVVKLPARLLDRLGMPAGKTVTLRFGVRRIRARLRGERRRW